MHTVNDPVRPARTAKAAILVSLAAALAACGGSQPPDGKGGPGGAPMAPPVTVAAALERNVSEWDEFVGRLEAIERVELRPRVSGYIEKIHYAQGAEVARGDLLFEIDARPFEQELRRADAALASAKTRLDLAAGELARVEKLVESGAVSRQEVDERASARRDDVSSPIACSVNVSIPVIVMVASMSLRSWSTLLSRDLRSARRSKDTPLSTMSSLVGPIGRKGA